MGIQGAKKCFEENHKLFVSAEKDPEKYNLYAGLLGLAKGIEVLPLEIIQLREDIITEPRTKGTQR